ncbi:MAG TPA: hypothetical protein VIF60_15680 [Burkholderiaceae bacterium]|jgi:hypothetical protein
MNTSNEEFRWFHAELKYQIEQVMNEPIPGPHSATGEIRVQPKALARYESMMRSHAAGCEAGR